MIRFPHRHRTNVPTPDFTQGINNLSLQTAYTNIKMSIKPPFSCSNMSQLLYCTLRLLFMLWLFNICHAIDLGPIYDCTSTTPLGVYQMPSLPNCHRKPDSEIKTGNALIYRYSPNVTKFPIFWCSYEEIQLHCDFTNPFSGKQNAVLYIQRRLHHKCALMR